jgi:hypothetical protein
MTPAVVHLGKAADLLVHRQAVLDTAFQAHPERFVRQAPKPPSLPTAVWINKPPDQGDNSLNFHAVCLIFIDTHRRHSDCIHHHAHSASMGPRLISRGNVSIQ